VDEEFGAAFSRRWGGLCWTHRLEDAEVILVAAGSLASEACAAADALRRLGPKAGVLGVRSYRPFPGQELARALQGARVAAVFDKSLSYGHEGPICSDLKSVLHNNGGDGPAVHGYIAGLGGRDVNADALAQAAARSLEWVCAENGPKQTEWLNCRIDV
jgi:pyruvate/2-oxoacid:ferredoxin oxidoreductase alpha subunit